MVEVTFKETRDGHVAVTVYIPKQPNLKVNGWGKAISSTFESSSPGNREGLHLYRSGNIEVEGIVPGGCKGSDSCIRYEAVTLSPWVVHFYRDQLSKMGLLTERCIIQSMR